MRTTIELSDEQRAQLLKLAAERGEKGFSCLVQEALTQYLASNQARAARVEAARSVLGTLDEGAARHFEGTVLKLRETWR